LPVVASNVEPPAVKLARGRDAARRAIGRGQLRPLMTADYQPRRATARVTTEEHTALGRDITSAQRTGPIPPPAVRGTRGGDATGMHPSRDEVREAVSAGHGGGDRLVREAAGTRLAIEIRPPAIRRAIRNEGARMQVARHDLHGMQAGRSDRDGAAQNARSEACAAILHAGCGPELAAERRPPAVDLSTSSDAARVLRTNGEMGEVPRDGDGGLGHDPVHGGGQHRSSQWEGCDDARPADGNDGRRRRTEGDRGIRDQAAAGIPGGNGNDELLVDEQRCVADGERR